ncbi:MAG: prephenate dehydrogenase/arogenate dehydrogenase family protein [Wenzhouxiangella sp.]|nr:MAG: prephenate dehydrogenase/arogenate dehydrogenase family protein [Wenzhouxiangella sp.]
MAEFDPNALNALRAQLDQVDADLVALAARRQEIVSAIGQLKQGVGRQVRDFRRERQVLDHVRRRALETGLDPDLAEDLLKRLIDASLARQEQERGQRSGRGRGQQALVIGGAGRLGGWLADFLDNQGFRVLLADPALDDEPDEGRYSDWLKAPATVDLTVVACPIAVSKGIIETLAERRQPGLVLEVASVKSGLIDTLRRCAANGLSICAAHPMFGPDTRLLAGRNVLLMDVGCAAAVDGARALFDDTMAEVHEIDIERHDRLMALVLGLSHALNIAFFSALARSGLSADELNAAASTTFARQLTIARDVAAENPALYFEIQSLNDHGKWSRELLEDAVRVLSKAVDEGRQETFVEVMGEGRKYLERLGGEV